MTDEQIEQVPRERIPGIIARLAARLEEPEATEYLMTTDQVAQMLQVEHKWVYRHRDELGGFSVSRKCLRFPQSKVMRYLFRRKAASE